MKENKNHISSSREASNAALAKLVLPIVLIIAVVVVLYIARDFNYTNPETPQSKFLETVLSYAVMGCEVASTIVIVTALMHGLISYIKRLFHRDYLVQIRSSESIRLRLGHRLSLGLEFAMAADILSIAISPRFNELLTLFVIILLRVLVTIFLEYDIEISTHYHMLPGTDWLNLFPEDEIKKEQEE